MYSRSDPVEFDKLSLLATVHSRRKKSDEVVAIYKFINSDQLAFYVAIVEVLLEIFIT